MTVLWMCLDCGYIFRWTRRGIKTRPKCPKCGSENVDCIEG